MILFVVPMLRFPVIATDPSFLKSPVPAPDTCASTYALVVACREVVGGPDKVSAPVSVPPVRANRVSLWVSV